MISPVLGYQIPRFVSGTPSRTGNEDRGCQMQSEPARQSGAFLGRFRPSRSRESSPFTTAVLLSGVNGSTISTKRRKNP